MRENKPTLEYNQYGVTVNANGVSMLELYEFLKKEWTNEFSRSPKEIELKKTVWL